MSMLQMIIPFFNHSKNSIENPRKLAIAPWPINIKKAYPPRNGWEEFYKLA